MPHNRSPKPGSKYYLPKYEYKTVVNFCFQYQDLKTKLDALDGQHAVVNDGMPHGTDTSDPTFSEATKRMEISEKIDVIEKTTKSCAGSALYPFMLMAITDETCTYNYLRQNYDIPMGHRQFSELRRKIYYNIAKRI